MGKATASTTFTASADGSVSSGLIDGSNYIGVRLELEYTLNQDAFLYPRDLRSLVSWGRSDSEGPGPWSYVESRLNLWDEAPKFDFVTNHGFSGISTPLKVIRQAIDLPFPFWADWVVLEVNVGNDGGRVRVKQYTWEV